MTTASNYEPQLSNTYLNIILVSEVLHRRSWPSDEADVAENVAGEAAWV